MWKVKKSKIHGTGVFATQDIPNNTKVIQYIGEKILKSEGDKRSEKRLKKYLNSDEDGSVYIFELNNKYDIDGSPKYNKARYINHSCNPNCEVEITRGHIWISSIPTNSRFFSIGIDSTVQRKYFALEGIIFSSPVISATLFGSVFFFTLS